MKTPWLVVCWTIWVALAVANTGSSDDSSLGKVGSSEQLSAEAVRACNGLAEGAGCGFAGAELPLDGVFRSVGQRERTACVPSDPARPIGDLSGEALRVCNWIPDGAECHSTDEGSQVTGNCRPLLENGPPACVPSRLSQRP